MTSCSAQWKISQIQMYYEGNKDLESTLFKWFWQERLVAAMIKAKKGISRHKVSGKLFIFRIIS
jgi:hypothetical protein